MRVSQLISLATAVAASVLRRTAGPKALYFLDNNPAGASVISLNISEHDGTLSGPVRTSTGGVGMFSRNANGVPMTDTLFSQDAVVVVGNRLFTVNPGSNTLSLFSIPSSDPTHPVLVDTKPLGGEFPNSVAFSFALHVACVLNTGANGGVSCFHVNNHGLTPMGDYIPLPINETTPPLGPPNTASDIVFNPSSTALFVSVKGDGMNPGYIYAFPIKDDKVVPKPVLSRPPELLVDFSVSFIDDGHAVVSDPAYGASFVEVAYPSLQVTVTKKVTIAGQTAICWTHYSERFHAVYLFDGGNPNITALDPTTGGVKYTIPGPEATMGSFDSFVSGEFLYVLQATAGVSVFSLDGSVGSHKIPSLVQNMDLKALGSRQGWQGMSVYPN